MHSLNSMFVVTRFLEKDINYQDCKYFCLLIDIMPNYDKILAMFAQTK